MKRVGLLFALAAITLVGCGSGGGTDAGTAGASGTTGTTAAGGNAKPFKITMIAKSTTNPVFLYAKSGAEAAAKELGPKNNLDIQIDWQTPPAEDGTVQAQNIQTAISQHAD